MDKDIAWHNLSEQIGRLANYIMENVAGEPSENEGAVDTAIRVMQVRADDVRELSNNLDVARDSLKLQTAENDQLRQANGKLEQAERLAIEQLKHCTTERDRYYGERETFRLEAREANKARDEAEADNVRLRDSLHSLTVANARLEGQLERVREFDPVTEQVRYRDGLPAIATDARGGGYMVPDASSDRGRDRWYRRG